MSKRRYSGDRRGTPWYDSDITPEVPQDQLGREFRAQQEPEPCGTVEQRAQAMREAESDDIKLNGVGLAILERRVAEQSTIIAGQRAAIEALRVWIQECSDGVSNLGMRVAKLEDALEVVRLDTIVNAELSNANQDTCIDNGARIEQLEQAVSDEHIICAEHGGVLAAWMRATNAQLHRLLWGHPALEQPTMAEEAARERVEWAIAKLREGDGD